MPSTMPLISLQWFQFFVLVLILAATFTSYNSLANTNYTFLGMVRRWDDLCSFLISVFSPINVVPSCGLVDQLCQSLAGFAIAKALPRFRICTTCVLACNGGFLALGQDSRESMGP